MTRRLVCAWALLLVACQRPQPAPASAPPATPPPGPVQAGKALLEQGQLDAALARLQEAPNSADAMYYQGIAWTRKAETAPLPTPWPIAPADPRRPYQVRLPEFKPEELKALELFARAVALQPAHGAAHLAAADLLAAHSARRYEVAASIAKRPGRGKPPAEPAPAAEGEPDLSPEHVLAEYQAAIQADPSSKVAVEGIIRYAARVGRLDDAKAGYDELVRRDKENPEPLVRYGDFLVSQVKDRQAAIEAYRQALIWRPDDQATRSKVADIYIAMGMEAFARREYATAEARFADAEKWVSDKNSPQGLKILDHQTQLREIRRPNTR